MSSSYVLPCLVISRDTTYLARWMWPGVPSIRISENLMACAYDFSAKLSATIHPTRCCTLPARCCTLPTTSLHLSALIVHRHPCESKYGFIVSSLTMHSYVDFVLAYRWVCVSITAAIMHLGTFLLAVMCSRSTRTKERRLRLSYHFTTGFIEYYVFIHWQYLRFTSFSLRWRAASNMPWTYSYLYRGSKNMSPYDMRCYYVVHDDAVLTLASWNWIAQSNSHADMRATRHVP